jgi:hypothetical protein
MIITDYKSVVCSIFIRREVKMKDRGGLADGGDLCQQPFPNGENIDFRTLYVFSSFFIKGYYYKVICPDYFVDFK